MLEIEDMEGENRLVHLILSNSIDFVVYRYLSSELFALQVCACVFYRTCVCVSLYDMALYRLVHHVLS